MKKIYLFLFAAAMFAGTAVKAQTVILSEDFELNSFYNKLDSIDVLPGNVIDTMWYSMDADYIPDGSGANRPDGYFPLTPFSPVDQYPTIYGGTPPDSNTVIGANSWNNNGDGPAGLESNWLVTCNIKLGTADTLFWKSAPRQTPRYCDGYEVLLSTTDNNDFSFTNVLFTAAEMTGTPPSGIDTNYADYTFSPPSGFVHGLDGTYIDPAGTSNAYEGRLRPFSVPLNAYANKNVFIAFHHNSHDDNLIEFDDVMVRGTPSNPNAGIDENNFSLGMSMYPNPVSSNATVNLNYTVATDANVDILIYDVAGKLVGKTEGGNQSRGRHFATINTDGLAKGFYTVKIATSAGQQSMKLIVK
jgi:hypothetical protein